MADLITSVLFNPWVLAAIGLAVVALFFWWWWPRRGGRVPVKKDGYSRYFNEEFKDAVIPSRNRFKTEVSEIFGLMKAELPDWEMHPNPGAWQVEHSLGGRVESNPLRASVIFAIFFDAAAYDRLPKKLPFSHATTRGLISEAIFLYRREFDLVELDRALTERLARDQARKETEGTTAWASR